MRIFFSIFLLASVCSLSAAGTAQSPAGATPAPPVQASGAPVTHAPDSAAKPVLPSGVLRPSLDSITQTVSGLNLDKWKGNSVRAEAATNISSIQRDLESTLPPLLATADAAPGSMSKVLPVSRNIDALYDVLLRIVDAARVSAPGDQFNQLQQTLRGLEQARRSLDDHLQESVAAQEKQVSDLQSSLKAQQLAMAARPAVATPPPAPCPAAPKKAPVKKHTPAKATTPPSTSQPATQPAATPKPQN